MDQQEETVERSARPKSRSDRIVKFAFLAVALAAAAGIYMMQRKGPELKGWQRNLAGALAEAERRDTRVVVVFMERPMSFGDRRLTTRCLAFYTSRKVLAHLKYVRVHLNNKANKQAMQEYEITRLPSVLLLDSTGKVLKKREGFMTDIDFCNDFLGVAYADVREPKDGSSPK